MTGAATVSVLTGLALAILYGVRFTGAAPSAPRSVIKAGSVAALAGAGTALGAPGGIVLGLALGAAGDFFLSRPGGRAFLAGMAVFAVGHLAYAAAFLKAGGASLPILPGIGLVALAVSTEVWLAALTLPASHVVALFGATLFLCSDLLLAFEMFVMKQGGGRRWPGRAVWAAYWGGQALILAGMAAAAGS